MAKLRMGMVGGGEGAFIGAVHRMAAELDGRIELVCGAFASDPERSRRSGGVLYGLPAARCYPSFDAMLTAEQALPAEQRMHFVTIATPNHLHVPMAQAALAAGFHVVCDKPLAHDLAAAQRLAEQVVAGDHLFCLTHNYTGYPMVREARALVAGGALGGLRRVVCEYLQGWLADDQERQNNKQAAWRTDPQRAGVAGCFGDIGTHGANLVEYVTGTAIAEVAAELNTFVAGRPLDDDGNVLLRLEGGARGVLFASQIAVGEENGLRLRLYGERGGLEWAQMEPNSLILRWPDRPMQVRRTGGVDLTPAAAAATRLPAGHPEGYLEAFANLYRSFALSLQARLDGGVVTLDFPTVQDGVRGMRFIEAVVASSRHNGVWTAL